MALTPADRELLDRCLRREPDAWNDFVDRFLGLIYHVVHYTAHLRSTTLRPEDIEDVCAAILLQVVENDFGVLRQFRGQSSLATYLTVIARRTCVHEINRRLHAPDAKARTDGNKTVEAEAEAPPRAQVGLESLEEVQRLMKKLPTREREVVRLYYLEGRSYEEISIETNIPVNTIGSFLSRARTKLRKDAAKAAQRSGSQTPPPLPNQVSKQEGRPNGAPL